MSSCFSPVDPAFDLTPRYDTLSDAQQADGPEPGTMSTPASYNFTSRRPARRRTVDQDRGTTQCGQETLGFLPLAEWDEYNSYDEDVPTRLHYSIEWKVAVNSKVISKDTEQDVVLAPAAYWRFCLKTKVESLVSKKLSHVRRVAYDDTSVVASVNDRSERDLVKRFDDIEVDWSSIERQLVRWGELFRAGKKLRVDISFNYVDSTQDQPAGGRRGEKRGSSATQRMLADRASQLDAEQETSSGVSVWRDVYALMRCPGPPCNLGPYCWRDPVGRKHYKLRTHHLKTLIELVQQGLTLNTHDDVPDDVCDQLYAEEHQRHERQSTATSAVTPSFPPITITNVMPTPSNESLPTGPAGETTDPSTIKTQPGGVTIPGPRDLAVIEYVKWQQAKVVDEAQKTEYQKAGSIILGDMMDLELVYQDQDPGSLVKSDVKVGVARRFVSDIAEWAQQYKATYNAEVENWCP